MCKFGSSIRYILVDLIDIYNNCKKEEFILKRDNYLKSINEPEDSPLYKIDTIKIQKIINFIDENIDSLTCENEMKMECFFNKNEPAFIDDEVNTRLFNFDYADKIYNFAMKKNLDLRIHTIIWYRHVPKQLIDYLKDRNKEDKKRLTLEFIKTYMKCLSQRYPNCYCVDVINEMVADPDELRFLEEENEPLYTFDEDGIRIDYWYETLGKDYYIEVFKLAREVFGSSTKLFYNDNNEGNKEKQRAYLNIVNKFKKYEQEHGIKLLDGFGMQSHYWGDETETKEYMEKLYSFYTNLGVELQITEFDVSNHSNIQIQNRIFNDFIDTIKKFNIKVFTMWGLNDELSWLSEYNPLLVDKECNKKSFANKYIDYFSSKKNIKN